MVPKGGARSWRARRTTPHHVTLGRPFTAESCFGGSAGKPGFRHHAWRRVRMRAGRGWPRRECRPGLTSSLDSRWGGRRDPRARRETPPPCPRARNSLGVRAREALRDGALWGAERFLPETSAMSQPAGLRGRRLLRSRDDLSVDECALVCDRLLPERLTVTVMASRIDANTSFNSRTSARPAAGGEKKCPPCSHATGFKVHQQRPRTPASCRGEFVEPRRARPATRAGAGDGGLKMV